MSRILAVDDSPSVRQLIKISLTEQGHQVTVAADGPEGLVAVRNGQFDLIVTDINMPRMNGIEFIKAVRDAGVKYTPVLVLTTEISQQIKAQAKQAGATGWVVKPFEADTFAATIKRVLP